MTCFFIPVDDKHTSWVMGKNINPDASKNPTIITQPAGHDKRKIIGNDTRINISEMSYR